MRPVIPRASAGSQRARQGSGAWLDILPRGATSGWSNRSARYGSKRRIATQSKKTPPPPAPLSKHCDGALPRRGRTYCDDCLPHYRREQYEQASRGSASGLSAIEKKKASGEDSTHGAKAAVRRAKTNIARKQQAREWDERHGKLVDLSAFRREILPLIQGVPLSRLQMATGLSLRYVSLIRRGERTPHPRHWQALLTATLAEDWPCRGG